MRAACLAVAASGTAACTTIGDQTSAATTRTFIGIVQVKLPATKGDLQAAEVKGLGLGWDAGPWLGWRSGNWVTADPAKCQLLIIIRSPAEAANAAEVLRNLKGTEPCMVDSSRPSPRG